MKSKYFHVIQIKNLDIENSIFRIKVKIRFLSRLKLTLFKVYSV